MLCRSLCSIAFHGPCSWQLNLGWSQNSIFAIYSQQAFCWCLILASVRRIWTQNTGFLSRLIEKDWNLILCMLRRTLCSIAFHGPCSWQLNLGWSQNSIFAIYSQCIVWPYVDIKHKFFQPANRKRMQFSIMPAVSKPLFYCISWPL
jgi:hypothetical protein